MTLNEKSDLGGQQALSSKRYPWPAKPKYSVLRLTEKHHKSLLKTKGWEQFIVYYNLIETIQHSRNIVNLVRNL